jgi:hypothetical protein
MKKLFICLMTLSSMSVLASSCPEINGIFACTGLDLHNPGKIVKVTTGLNREGRGALIFNNYTFMTEGKDGVFCTNDAFRDKSRNVVVIDKDTFERSFTFQKGATEQIVSSTCVRLR